MKGHLRCFWRSLKTLEKRGEFCNILLLIVLSHTTCLEQLLLIKTVHLMQHALKIIVDSTLPDMEKWSTGLMQDMNQDVVTSIKISRISCLQQMCASDWKNHLPMALEVYFQLKKTSTNTIMLFQMLSLRDGVTVMGMHSTVLDLACKRLVIVSITLLEMIVKCASQCLIIVRGCQRMPPMQMSVKVKL